MNNEGTTDRSAKAPTFGYTGDRPGVIPSAEVSDRSRTLGRGFGPVPCLYFRQPYITEVETKAGGRGGRYPVTSADLVTSLPGYLEAMGQGARIIAVHKKGGPVEFCRSIKRTRAGRLDRVPTNTRTRARAYLATNNLRSDA